MVCNQPRTHQCMASRQQISSCSLLSKNHTVGNWLEGTFNSFAILDSNSSSVTDPNSTSHLIMVPLVYDFLPSESFVANPWTLTSTANIPFLSTIKSSPKSKCKLVSTSQLHYMLKLITGDAHTLPAVAVLHLHRSTMAQQEDPAHRLHGSRISSSGCAGHRHDTTSRSPPPFHLRRSRVGAPQVFDGGYSLGLGFRGNRRRGR